MTCKHEHLHMEKMIADKNSDPYGPIIKPVIVTFCADCGKELKQIDIQI